MDSFDVLKGILLLDPGLKEGKLKVKEVLELTLDSSAIKLLTEELVSCLTSLLVLELPRAHPIKATMLSAIKNLLIFIFLPFEIRDTL